MTTSHPDGITLSDYADDGLPEAARADVRTHLTMCGECQKIVDGFRAIKSSARALPPLQPRRESWDRIERAIRSDRPSRITPAWSWLAAAAALLLATFIGFKLADLRRQTAATSSAEEPAGTPSAQWVEAEILQAEQHYQKAITGLEKIANDGRATLDPQTASTLEKNLRVIDQAISESRAAVRAQPASEPAQASLLENFKSKIALLQDTVALINQMRRDGGLKQKGT